MIQNSSKPSPHPSSKTPFLKTQQQTISLQQLKSLFKINLFFTGFYLLSFFGAKKFIETHDSLREHATDLANNLTSILHALIIVPASACYLTRQITLTSWYKTAAASLAYFWVDLVLLPSTTNNDNTFILFIVHHITLLVVLIFYLQKYPTIIARGLLSETTAPFLYTCNFLRKIGQQDTFLYQLFGILTLLTWAIFRLFNFTYLYKGFYEKNASLFEYVAFAPLVLMNYFWFFKLLSFYHKATS